MPLTTEYNFMEFTEILKIQKITKFWKLKFVQLEFLNMKFVQLQFSIDDFGTVVTSQSCEPATV